MFLPERTGQDAAWMREKSYERRPGGSGRSQGCHARRDGERERWDEVDLVTLIALFGLTAAGCKEVCS